VELGLAVVVAVVFALTNGFHDAANAIAMLVVTRGARAGQAIVLSAAFNVLGVVFAGTALSHAGIARATQAADAAVKSQRRLEHVYRAAMSALVDREDLREVAARRELYRRLARTSDRLVDVAERIWYSVLKES